METESALYQLMGVRMNGVMNGITNSDGQYQEIIRKSDEYSDRLEEMELPEEVRMLAYLLGFSDCKEMLLEKRLFTEPQQMS